MQRGYVYDRRGDGVGFLTTLDDLRALGHDEVTLARLKDRFPNPTTPELAKMLRSVADKISEREAKSSPLTPFQPSTDPAIYGCPN